MNTKRAFLLAVPTWLAVFLSIEHAPGIDPFSFGTTTFILAFVLCWSILSLPFDNDKIIGSSDPWRHVATNRRYLLVATLTMLSACLLLFADVAFFDHSMVSVPWFNVGLETTPETAGFGHTVDPWAGFLIEGPGIFLTGASFDLGQLPFWNPFEACGTPYAANGEMGVFSVLQLPLHLSPTIAHWDFFALLRIVLVSLGGWLCAFSLGNSPRSALLVGFGLAYGAIFTLFANLVHLNGALVIPWFVFATVCFLAKRNLRRWLFLVGTIALGFNGGNPQPIACALVIFCPVVLLHKSESTRQKMSVLAGYGSAAFFASLLCAFSLLPLADLLARSENRTFFALEIMGTASHLVDWFAPGGPLVGVATDGLSGPPWWRLGATSCFLAIVGLTAIFAKKENRFIIGVFIGLLLFHGLAIFPSFNQLFATLPIVGGLKWTKYATIAQLLILLLSAHGMEACMKRLSYQRLAVAATLAMAILVHAVYFRGRIDSQISASLAFVVGISLILAIRRSPLWCVALLPILLIAESAWYRPDYPQRLDEITVPEGLPYGSNIKEPHWTPIAHRTMGYRDAVAPLLSGLQGWYDIRSVGALPLTPYHRLMAPYMNCGPWPPYMLLGASREIVLSPYFDLAGVRQVIFREGDFNDMVRERREDLLEDSPYVRFGEFQRALDYASIQTSTLVAPDAFEGSFLLLPAPATTMRLNLAAKSARIGIRFESPSKEPFTVKTGFDNDVRTITDTQEYVFTIENAMVPISFSLALDASRPVRFILTQWWVDRHISKGRFDFEPVENPLAQKSGIRILRNKYPMAIARVMHQGRTVPPEDLSDVLAQHVATGEGWDPRHQLLLIKEDTSNPESLPKWNNKLREEKATLWRRGWNQMRVDCDNKNPGWLSLAVSYDPGWSARIDGKDVPIFQGNGAFMAIPLNKTGNQQVAMTYTPPGFRLGLWISGLSTLVAIFLLALSFWPSLRR